MSIKKLLPATVLGFLIFATACTQGQPENKAYSIISDSQNIVSTRGSDEAQFFSLIKLKTPALLEKSKQVNGITVIDTQLKLKIETEQAEAIAALMKLSNQVQVVYRYKMVLNGLAIVGPASIYNQLSQIGVITAFEKVGNFERMQTSVGTKANLGFKNSVKFIGADQLHLQGISGQGMKVGVLDTGIDYTHSMFGGAGTSAAYKAVDPSLMNGAFPSAKVAGGIDLVGTKYNSGALDFSLRIPMPDLNPIDEAGHGTHVAGTIAGRGDNNVTLYDGVAPDALLYAIKVFGARGSTSDMVVIAGLEFAADPNGDAVLDDQLDVVNLSLGSSYGTPKILYSEAIKNLVRGGTSAVISAGNAGHEDYIVGAPGTATEALSVAASIDDSEHNWRFNSSLIKIDTEKYYVKAVEGATTKPITDLPLVSGEFLYVGLADKDFAADVALLVKGKVALIDRGVVSFNDKVKRAVAAGAIGVVMVNNIPGEPFVMGTTDAFAIPGIMISQDMGSKIKAALSASPSVPVSIDFLGDQAIEEPDLIDTITSFSSKGPRSVDGFLKPEIAAPGYQIISAAVGSGNKATEMSGTSMAAPHMSGVMALMKQGFKARGLNLSALELKNIVMGHAKTISEKGVVYPVTLQGAGRVQADAHMINSAIVADQPSISLGEISLNDKRNFLRPVIFKNLSGAALSLTFVFEGHPGVKLISSPSLSLGSGKIIPTLFNLQLDGALAKKEIEEFGGLIKVLENNIEIYRIPLLAVVHKKSNIKSVATELLVDNKLEVTTENKGVNEGSAIFFNLLAKDDRKKAPEANKNTLNTDCDLESAGYRIVTHKNAQGVDAQFIQFAVKTYKIMTTWNYCDVSILFDAENDGKVEQELVATKQSTIEGLADEEFSSVLMDTALAQKIRAEFEVAVKNAGGDPVKLAALAGKEDYSSAILDIQALKLFNGSTLNILEAELSLLKKDAVNNLNFKILTTYYMGTPAEFDDYLKKDATLDTFTISSVEEDQPFYNFAENLLSDVIAPASNKVLQFNHGKSAGSLIIYYPQNDFSVWDFMNDQQSQVVPLK